jgi:hypothetical protein
MSLALNMFSRRSSSLAPRPFAMVPLLLLVLSHPVKNCSLRALLMTAP